MRQGYLLCASLETVRPVLLVFALETVTWNLSRLLFGRTHTRQRVLSCLARCVQPLRSICSICSRLFLCVVSRYSNRWPSLSTSPSMSFV